MGNDEKLTEILAELSEVRATVRRIEARLERQPAQAAPAARSTNRAAVTEVEPATDAVLDSETGNPVVKWDPKYGWDGPSYAGSRFSECPADYLDIIAKARESSMAKKAPNDQWLERDRHEAACARGWARRKRAEAIAEAQNWSANAQQDDLGF